MITMTRIVCPKCDNDDDNHFKTDATPGRAPTRNRPGVSAVLHGWICAKCGEKIPEPGSVR
jgi:hypothetical protein